VSDAPRTAPARGGDRPEEERVVFRDKRRIDPTTGAVRARDPAAAPADVPTVPATDAAVAAVRQELAERTADLQRLKAEYDNYRRRVERDRLAVAEQALASVLVGLLPVLDDIGRARAHGELEGGFRSVAESLETTLTKLGLVAYGEPGEPFDPTVHEALMHSFSSDVDVPTAVEILQPGYRLGERILRPARVAVAEPAPVPVASTETAAEE
jgi:molecular chaperone GrpE